MPDCPLCADRLLRHVRHSQIYWFCRSCWQEMPLFEHESLPAEIPGVSSTNSTYPLVRRSLIR